MVVNGCFFVFFLLHLAVNLLLHHAGQETTGTTAGRIRKIDAAVVQVSKPVGNSRH